MADLKLEQFIGQLTSGKYYCENEGVRRVVDNELEEIRRVIEGGDIEEAKRVISQLTMFVNSQRGAVDTVVNKVINGEEGLLDLSPILDEARAYMEKVCGPGHFFGPREIEQALGGYKVTEEMVPVLPSWREIIPYAALGHVLRLRTSLSVQDMDDFAQKVPGLEYGGFSDTQKQEDVYRYGAPKVGWAFTSDGFLPGTEGKRYAQQTDILASYIASDVYDRDALPVMISDVMDEWNEWKAENDVIRPIASDSGKDLVAFQVNDVFRPAFADCMFDFLVEYCCDEGLQKPERWNGLSWTSNTLKNGEVLAFRFSDMDEDSMGFSSIGPNMRDNTILGCSFSQTLFSPNPTPKSPTVTRNPESIPSVYEAREYMKETCGDGHFFGPEEIRRAFELEPMRSDTLPSLPTWGEIERHAKKGHVLRLHLSEVAGNTLFNADKMGERLAAMSGLDVEGFEILQQQEIRSGAPTAGWKFTSLGVLPESQGETYLGQTSKIVDYLKSLYVDEEALPSSVARRIKTWRKWYEAAAQDGTYDYDDDSFVYSLIRSEFNMYFRPKLVGMMFDFLVERGNDSFQKNRWKGSTLTSTRFGLRAVGVGFGGKDDDRIALKTFAPGQGFADVGCHISHPTIAYS